MKIEKILAEVSKQRAELIYKGFKPKYVFVDHNTYRDLKVSSTKLIREDGHYYKTYLDLDRLFGLLVLIVENAGDRFVSVGI